MEHGNIREIGSSNHQDSVHPTQPLGMAETTLSLLRPSLTANVPILGHQVDTPGITVGWGAWRSRTTWNILRTAAIGKESSELGRHGGRYCGITESRT